jgi:hypothetical protein
MMVLAHCELKGGTEMGWPEDQSGVLVLDRDRLI